MSVQDLFRIVLDDEEIEIELNKEIVWFGKVKDIPNCYFNCIVNLLYSVPYACESYIRIIIDNAE
jgi:hypothetical protein